MTKSNADNGARDCWARPHAEKVDPIRPKRRSGKDEPTPAKSITDRLEPRGARPRDNLNEPQ